MSDNKRPYPLTVTSTRYGGAYEGGAFAAFPVDFHNIPAIAAGDDSSCSLFWSSPTARFIGRGETIIEAVADMKRRTKGADWRVVWDSFTEWGYGR